MLFIEHSLGMDIIHDSFDVGYQHLAGGVKGEEGTILSSPVIMDQYSIDSAHFFCATDIIDEKIGIFVKKGFDSILLIFIDKSHGGAADIHQGYQTFPEAVQNSKFVKLGSIQIRFVLFAHTFPVQSVQIRPLNQFFPVIHIGNQRMTGLYGSAACLGDEYPVQTKPSSFGERIIFNGVFSVKNQVGGIVIRDQTGTEVVDIAECPSGLRHPAGCFTGKGASEIFPGSNGAIVNGFRGHLSRIGSGDHGNGDR